MFTISSETDYAMLLIEYLANKKSILPLSKIVEEVNLPPRLLARIAARLTKEKILKSREGIFGGYKLIKPLNKIKLADFLRIFGGNLQFAKCENKEHQCRWKNNCRHGRFWRIKLKQNFFKNLKNVTLKDVVM